MDKGDVFLIGKKKDRWTSDYIVVKVDKIKEWYEFLDKIAKGTESNFRIGYWKYEAWQDMHIIKDIYRRIYLTDDEFRELYEYFKDQKKTFTEFQHEKD